MNLLLGDRIGIGFLDPQQLEQGTGGHRQQQDEPAAQMEHRCQRRYKRAPREPMREGVEIYADVEGGAPIGTITSGGRPAAATS